MSISFTRINIEINNNESNFINKYPNINKNKGSSESSILKFFFEFWSASYLVIRIWDIHEYTAINVNIFVRFSIKSEYSSPSQKFKIIEYKGKSTNNKIGINLTKIFSEYENSSNFWIL